MVIQFKKKAKRRHAESKTWRQSTKNWKAQVRREIFKRDGCNCFYCNYPFTVEYKPTIEHLLPVAAGGSDHLSNLVLACDLCNKVVGNWDLIRKIKYREYRHKAKI